MFGNLNSIVIIYGALKIKYSLIINLQVLRSSLMFLDIITIVGGQQISNHWELKNLQYFRTVTLRWSVWMWMRQVSLCGTAPGRPSPFTAYPLYASVACGPKTNGTLLQLQEYYILHVTCLINIFCEFCVVELGSLYLWWSGSVMWPKPDHPSSSTSCDSCDNIRLSHWLSNWTRPPVMWLF